MTCPHCNSKVGKIVRSDADKSGVRKRRIFCGQCSVRYTTYSNGTATVSVESGGNSAMVALGKHRAGLP